MRLLKRKKIRRGALGIKSARIWILRTEQIKYGHIVSTSKILQLVWWGQRLGTRVRWRADRESEIIGTASKGEKKKLKTGFVPARSLSLPKAELSPKILKSWNPSPVVRNLFKSLPAVCISHSLSPGAWTVSALSMQVKVPTLQIKFRMPPYYFKNGNYTKNYASKNSKQKQSCTKIQTVSSLDSHLFVYVWYFLCSFPLLSSSQRTNTSKDQYRPIQENNPTLGSEETAALICQASWKMHWNIRKLGKNA